LTSIEGWKSRIPGGSPPWRPSAHLWAPIERDRRERPFCWCAILWQEVAVVPGDVWGRDESLRQPKPPESMHPTALESTRSSYCRFSVRTKVDGRSMHPPSCLLYESRGKKRRNYSTSEEATDLHRTHVDRVFNGPLTSPEELVEL